MSDDYAQSRTWFSLRCLPRALRARQQITLLHNLWACILSGVSDEPAPTSRVPYISPRCLNHISRPRCPLCRTQFEHGSFLKLHVDVDNVRSSLGTTSQPPPPSPTVTEQEARRLQEAIASVANKGSTEPSLRHLIAECKTFLAEQPRHLVRIAFISYYPFAKDVLVSSRT